MTIKVEPENDNLKILKWLRQLREFWPYLKLTNELQIRMDELDKEIVGTIWEWKLKYTSLDLKRVERKILQQFIELPENLIKEFDNITVQDELEEMIEVPDWLKGAMNK